MAANRGADDGERRQPRDRQAREAAGERARPGKAGQRTTAAATTGATPARKRDRKTRQREGGRDRPPAARAAKRATTSRRSQGDDAETHEAERRDRTKNDQDMHDTPEGDRRKPHRRRARRPLHRGNFFCPAARGPRDSRLALEGKAAKRRAERGQPCREGQAVRPCFWAVAGQKKF